MLRALSYVSTSSTLSNFFFAFSIARLNWLCDVVICLVQLTQMFATEDRSSPLTRLPPPFQFRSNFSWGHLRPHSFLFQACTFAEGQVFPTPYAVSLLPHEAPLRSISLFCINLFFGILTYVSPGWFPFLSATNLTKFERLHRAASRTITGCLPSFPISLLTQASLPPLRVTLTHFTLSSYERALRLPTSFPISG